MAINDVAGGCHFFVNFWVIKTHNFVSGLRTLQPKKLKTFFKNLGFLQL